MSKGGGSTTSTQKTDPWSGQQPYLVRGFQEASNNLNSGGPQYYPDQTYAGSNSYQNNGIANQYSAGADPTQAETGAQNAAGSIFGNGFTSANPGNSTYNSAAGGGMNNTAGTGTLGMFANGGMLGAGNPYFQQMANTTAANVMPQIQSQFNAGNRMDSGLASRAVGQGLGDSIGGMAYNNYQHGLGQMQNAAGTLSNIGAGNIQTQLAGAQGLSNNFNSAIGNQIGAMGQAPGLAQLPMMRAGAQTDAGNQYQALQQKSIDDAIQRFNYNQQLPYSNLNNYMNLINGNFGSSTSSTQPYQNNMIGQIGSAVGGVAALAPMLAMI